MRTFHIVQGGIENGDKAWLEKAASNSLAAKRWIVPKSAAIGDEVVIYVQAHGFFATAKISTETFPREDWDNRYGAGLHHIVLIEPPISIGFIRKQVPSLTWANYPRSITTPSPRVADQIRTLIQKRKSHGMHGIVESELDEAGILELRAAALLRARPKATAKEVKRVIRIREAAIGKYVLARAKGVCEGCADDAPFSKKDDEPYLEPHHIDKVADDGPDHPDKVIALCPNCHRRAHHSKDANRFNASLKRKLSAIASR